MSGRILAVLRARQVIVAILLIGLTNAQSTYAQNQGEAAQIRELAERLLLPSYGYSGRYPMGSPGGAPVEEPSVELLVGRLPNDPGLDVPVPPGGRLLGSAVRSGSMYPASNIEVVIEAPGAPGSVAAYYDRSLPDFGWSSGSFGMGSTGGFQQVAAQRSSYFCRDEDNATLTVQIQPRAKQPDMADVRMTLSGSSPPCLVPTPPSAPSDLPYGGRFSSPYQSLPTLYPPDGVTIRQSGGYGGSSGSFSMEARAWTAMSAADLEAFFARQVAESGWTRLSGSADGLVAWSAWSVPDAEGAQGFLSIRELPGTDQRILSIRTDSEADDQGGSFYSGYSYGPYGSPYVISPPSVSITPAGSGGLPQEGDD